MKDIETDLCACITTMPIWRITSRSVGAIFPDLTCINLCAFTSGDDMAPHADAPFHALEPQQAQGRHAEGAEQQGRVRHHE